MSLTQRSQPGPPSPHQWSNHRSTGIIPPALSRREAETAEGFGKRPQATKSTAKTTRAKPRLSRIQRSKCEELGWSELAGIELVAAAGVRMERERGLRCTAGRGSACVRLLGTH